MKLPASLLAVALAACAHAQAGAAPLMEMSAERFGG